MAESSCSASESNFNSGGRQLADCSNVVPPMAAPRTRDEALRLVDARRWAANIFDLSLVALVVILLVLLANYYLR